MASNHVRWVGNLNGCCEPLIVLGLFGVGSSVPIKRGEILEKTGNTNTEWVPVDSDANFAGNIAIANEEIKSGDRAGYYEIIVPRPGDIFEFELATAAATVFGASLYYSSSEKLAASGSNVLAIAVGQEHYPQKQGHLSDAPGGDAGVTVRSTTHVRVTFDLASSLYAAMVV